MAGGQIILEQINDAQLEAVLDVKKNNEGQFQLLNLQITNLPFPPGPPAPAYYPNSPWGMGPGRPGQWYGPGSPWGAFPPNLQPGPQPGQQPQPSAPSSYNVTLIWNDTQNLKTVAQVIDRLAQTP